MAKHKKRAVARTSKKHHGGRRVGAVNTGGWEQDIMESIGNVAGQLAATAVQRMGHNLDPKIVSGVELVGGVMIKRHFDHPFMKGVGWGINGAGGMGLASEFGVIKGIDEVVQKMFDKTPEMQETEIPNKQMKMPGMQGRLPDAAGGISNFDTLSGMNNFTTMSGDQEMDPLHKEFEEVNSLGW